MKKHSLTKKELDYFRTGVMANIGQAFEKAEVIENIIAFAVFLANVRGYEFNEAVKVGMGELVKALEEVTERTRRFPIPHLTILKRDSKSWGEPGPTPGALPAEGPDPDLPPGDPPEVKIPALEGPLEETKDGGEGEEKA